MKLIGIGIVSLSLLGFSSFASTGASLEKTGLFIGLGGSYNLVRINSNLEGTMNVTQGVPPRGLFSGSTGPYHKTKETFAPEAQIGYFRHFTNSNWLWGVKALYQYVGTNITINGTASPAGTYINLTNTDVVTTVDKISMGSLQLKINDEFVLPLFLGRSFKQSFLYVGVGPSLFKTSYSSNHSSDVLSGYYTGNLGDFSNSTWLWGGAVQAGMAYYLSPSWFVNINYMFAGTGQNLSTYLMPFTPSVNRGLNTGTVSFTKSQRIIAEEFKLSINKVFSL